MSNTTTNQTAAPQAETKVESAISILESFNEGTQEFLTLTQVLRKSAREGCPAINGRALSEMEGLVSTLNRLICEQTALLRHEQIKVDVALRAAAIVEEQKRRAARSRTASTSSSLNA